MTTLPSFVHLSLEQQPREPVPTAVPGEPSSPKAPSVPDGGETTWEALPDEIKGKILALVHIGDDPCGNLETFLDEKVIQISKAHRQASSHEDYDAAYEYAAHSLGLYGIYSNWKDVLHHYEEVNKTPPDNAKAYFRLACKQKAEWMGLFASPPQADVMGQMLAYANETGHPFMTLVLGMYLSNQNGSDSLKDVDVTRLDYGVLAKNALETNSAQLQRVPTTRSDFGELAMIAVRRRGAELKWVPDTHTDFFKLAQAAVANDPLALAYVFGTRTPNTAPNHAVIYNELATTAVQKDGRALRYVPCSRDKTGPFSRIDPIQLAKLVAESSMHPVPLDCLEVIGDWHAKGHISGPEYTDIAKIVIEKSSYLALKLVPKTYNDISFAELAIHCLNNHPNDRYATLNVVNPPE